MQTLEFDPLRVRQLEGPAGTLVFPPPPAGNQTNRLGHCDRGRPMARGFTDLVINGYPGIVTGILEPVHLDISITIPFCTSAQKGIVVDRKCKPAVTRP